MATFSYSRLGTFKSCPRKYYYRYVAKVPLDEEPEFIATFLGSRVHDALEHIYNCVGRGLVISEIDALDFYRCGWAAEWTPSVVIPDGLGAPEDICRQGEEWVRDYYRRYVPFNDAKTIGLEMEIAFPIDDAGRHRMNGYIDRLACSPAGVWQIHDYKTNNRLPTQADMDRNSQLPYYEIGIRQMWPDIEQVELVWHYVRFDQTIRSRRTAEQLESLRQDTLTVIADVESRGRNEAAFPTHESGLCAYCEYQSVCPVRKHLFAVQQLPENQFLSEPGVQLVGRWNSLKAKQDELKAEIAQLETEIDQIKKALTVMAARDEMTTIVGSDKEVAIVDEKKVMFPRKGQEPAEAAQLEAILRSSPWWNQVSCLDRATLAALWEARDKQATELRTILEEFAWVDEHTTLRLRKRHK
jgi:putative RecB family exonuclease